MGLFDKKYCDVCGDKIGLLGNRKLEDGNLCKECTKQLSPFMTDRRQSTVAEIKEHLEYRKPTRERWLLFRRQRSSAAKRKSILTRIKSNGWSPAFATGAKEIPTLLIFHRRSGAFWISMKTNGRFIMRWTGDRRALIHAVMNTSTFSI